MTAPVRNIVFILLILSIVGGVWYFFFRKDKGTTGVDDGQPDNVANLNENSNAYQNWGLTLDRPTIDTIRVKGQGNGNFFEHVWSKSDLREIWKEASVDTIAPYVPGGRGFAEQLVNDLPLNNPNNWPSTIRDMYVQEILTFESSIDNDFFISVFIANSVSYEPYIYAGIYNLNIGPPNQPGTPMSSSVMAAIRMNEALTSAPQYQVLKEAPKPPKEGRG
jgi:hypothetical protein